MKCQQTLKRFNQINKVLLKKSKCSDTFGKVSKQITNQFNAPDLWEKPCNDPQDDLTPWRPTLALAHLPPFH